MLMKNNIYRVNATGELFKMFIEMADGRYQLWRIDLDEESQPLNETVLADYPNLDEARAAMRHVIQNGQLPLRSGVAVRQTRTGAWLVFYAMPARNGRGHNTGVQCGRFNEATARKEAAKIAAAREMDVIEFIPCDTNPPGELRQIPWNSSMYEYIYRDALPLDKHERPITGYCRYLTDGTRIYPERERIVDAKMTEAFFDERLERVYYYIDRVDGVMYTVRIYDPGESKILFHSRDLERALLHLNWLMEQKPDWDWTLEWRK